MLSHPLGDGSELRLYEERHAAELFALVDKNRARLRQWLPWVDGSTEPAHTAAFIRGQLTAFAEGRGAVYGIWVDGAIAGSIGYHDVEPASRRVAIGYWIDAAHEGRGIMMRAVKALVAHAFGELGMKRVEIRVAPDNARSRAIPERLGFREEGTLRQYMWLYDHCIDEVVYGLLVDEWKG